METKELVQHAIDKKYTDFDSATKAILSAKVATKLADSGYFDRLNQAKGITEEDEKLKDDFKKMKKDAGTDKEEEDEKEISKDLKNKKEK